MYTIRFRHCDRCAVENCALASVLIHGYFQSALILVDECRLHRPCGVHPHAANCAAGLITACPLYAQAVCAGCRGEAHGDTARKQVLTRSVTVAETGPIRGHMPVAGYRNTERLFAYRTRV